MFWRFFVFWRVFRVLAGFSCFGGFLVFFCVLAGFEAFFVFWRNLNFLAFFFGGTFGRTFGEILGFRRVFGGGFSFFWWNFRRDFVLWAGFFSFLAGF